MEQCLILGLIFYTPFPHGSASARIAPVINSLNADFSKKETWLGHGIDYGKNQGSFYKQTGTVFDDYGLLFYILSLIFTLSCSYKFLSLATIFMFAGVTGRAGTNIQYAWELMMVLTCVRYFYENRYNPEIYEEEEEEDKNKELCENSAIVM